jgi:hypothetical protein
MTTFRDDADREWAIKLNIGTVERVRKAPGSQFNLYDTASLVTPTGANADDPAERKPLAEALASDLPLFWELLWCLCEPQATARQVTPEQFGEAMAGRCLLAARNAFRDEWSDFFRQIGRSDCAAVLLKQRTYETKALAVLEMKLADPRLKEIDQEVERALEITAETQLINALNSGRGKLRELSESSQANSG